MDTEYMLGLSHSLCTQTFFLDQKQDFEINSASVLQSVDHKEQESRKYLEKDWCVFYNLQRKKAVYLNNTASI